MPQVFERLRSLPLFLLDYYRNSLMLLKWSSTRSACLA
jgi:hypothetical protein